MPKTQQQAFCSRCDKHTLHTRQIEMPNHFVHLIMIFCCCGAWLPFYLLLCLAPKKHPWMCSVCGERMGHVPRDVKKARRAKAKAKRIERKDQKQQIREEKSERRARDKEARAPSPEEAEQSRLDRERKRAERVEQGKQAVEATKTAGKATLKVFIDQVTNAVKQANRGLEAMAGGDVVLLRIWQGTFLAVGLIVASFLIYYLTGTLGLR